MVQIFRIIIISCVNETRHKNFSCRLIELNAVWPSFCAELTSCQASILCDMCTAKIRDQSLKSLKVVFIIEQNFTIITTSNLPLDSRTMRTEGWFLGGKAALL
jgi:hypothetical protein